MLKCSSFISLQATALWWCVEFSCFVVCFFPLVSHWEFWQTDKILKMPQTKFLRSPVSSLPPFSRPHLVHPHLNLKVKCKVNKCIHLIIATVLFGRVIFTKCFFSKLQLTELLPGKGYRLVWSGCEVNGLLSSLIELLGMQAFLRRPKFKYQRINFIFKGWPYKSVMGATVSCFMLLPGKIFQLMKKENALISALEVKFIFLLASESVPLTSVSST